MELFKSFCFRSERVTLQSCNIHDVFRNRIPFPGFEVKARPDFMCSLKIFGPFHWSVIGHQDKYI